MFCEVRGWDCFFGCNPMGGEKGSLRETAPKDSRYFTTGGNWAMIFVTTSSMSRCIFTEES
jgi:hypothetical protein